jgi:thiol:disulfide interchange protein DsbD
MYKQIKYFFFLLLIIACNNEPKERFLCPNSTPQKYWEGYEIFAFDNYETALNCAKYTNKPMFVYFTCLGCVGIGDIFVKWYSKDKEVTQIIDNEYIAVVLMTDDTKRFDSTGTTIDSINAELEIRLTKKTSQPTFAIIDSQEKLIDLAEYDRSIDNFKAFLKRNVGKREGVRK